MRVIITYNNITGEDLEKLLENDDVEDVKIVSGTSAAVEDWLETRDINGHGVSLAYNEFCEENPSTKISLIYNLSASKLLLLTALAIAEFRTLLIGSLTVDSTLLRIAIACPTFLPLIKSITNFALRGDILTDFAIALTSMIVPPIYQLFYLYHDRGMI